MAKISSGGVRQLAVPALQGITIAAVVLPVASWLYGYHLILAQRTFIGLPQVLSVLFFSAVLLVAHRYTRPSAFAASLMVLYLAAGLVFAGPGLGGVPRFSPTQTHFLGLQDFWFFQSVSLFVWATAIALFAGLFAKVARRND